MIFRIKTEHPKEDFPENRIRIIHLPRKVDLGIVQETDIKLES